MIEFSPEPRAVTDASFVTKDYAVEQVGTKETFPTWAVYDIAVVFGDLMAQVQRFCERAGAIMVHGREPKEYVEERLVVKRRIEEIGYGAGRHAYIEETSEMWLDFGLAAYAICDVDPEDRDVVQRIAHNWTQPYMRVARASLDKTAATTTRG